MLLKIENLSVSYNNIKVLDNVNLSIEKGQCVGLVGESGCGTTTAGLSITKLIPEHKGKVSSGKILLEGEDLLKLDPEALRKIRGKKVSYVFQEPFSSLNPVFTIYDQLKECFSEKKDVDQLIADILKRVGLDKIIGKTKLYPHELSGGMQQRVVIAMAIASQPDLLILDEPTTALDVTVQKQILDLIVGLKENMGLSILYISHDLRTVFNVSDSVSVMYAGRVIEDGPKKDIVSRPSHPYTKGLIASIPSFGHRKKRFNA
ncbi:MAG: ABC transporter ATP-binding protein, partial [Candidatus Omnitrophota bacterium]|nr:ABC transporter ATP-binding protein [Candidatus Omnitrophota bacterium]